MAKKDKYDFRWYELGEENPFNKRVLDVRSLTWSVVATTQSKQIAETYNRLRTSLGTEYIDVEIENGQKAACNLEYPHDGAKLEGIVSKADTMDVKWDIYIHNNVFLFVRSWTGGLIYKAHADVLDDKIIIKEIEFADDENTALNNIHFLLKTHAMGQVLPHKVPSMNSDESIALHSFQQFGKKACYACLEDILDCQMVEKD